MTRIFAIIILAVLVTVGSPLEAQTDSVVTYQGELKQNGSPITSPGCDFEFSLFADAGGVTQIGSTQTIVGVAVTDGLFTVELNSGNEFGPTAFIGDERFLEIAVKCPPEVGFTPLSPLQPITPAPYALALPGMRTMPSGNVDNPDSVNVVGGDLANSIGANVGGATISGGGPAPSLNSLAPNSVTESFGTVGGGSSNLTSGYFSTIGGGWDNDSSGYASTIGGGQNNENSGPLSTIAGGGSNTASNESSTIGGGSFNDASGRASTIGGGFDNDNSGDSSTIAGGEKNIASGPLSTIGGGYDNDNSGFFSTIAGGESNTASNQNSTVGGGFFNSASGSGSTVPGGSHNEANGNQSFAAGRNAIANHAGTFVWSSSADDFASTDFDQFLINASGGVGIGTNNPQSRLHIAHDAVGAGWGVRIGSAATSNFQGGMRISDDGFFDVTNKANIGAPNFARLNSLGVWTVVSDRRMKDEIAPLTGVLDRAMRLDPVSYRYKNQDRVRMPDPQIGFIAQEVEPLFPSLVSHGDDLLTMNYNGLGVVAIAAIQELKHQTDVEMKELRDEKHADIALLRSEKDKEIEQLRMAHNREIESLRAQHEQLEKRFTELELMISRPGTHHN